MNLYILLDGLFLNDTVALLDTLKTFNTGDVELELRLSILWSRPARDSCQTTLIMTIDSAGSTAMIG